MTPKRAKNIDFWYLIQLNFLIVINYLYIKVFMHSYNSSTIDPFLTQEFRLSSLKSSHTDQKENLSLTQAK